MSRGLGKIERKIIELLIEREKKPEERGWDKWTFLSDLPYIYGLFEGLSNEVGDIIKYANRAQYVSVWRAVKSLEKKGIIQTQIFPYSPQSGQGGITHALKVKLNVDFMAQVPCNQHLNGEEDVKP